MSPIRSSLPTVCKAGLGLGLVVFLGAAVASCSTSDDAASATTSAAAAATVSGEDAEVSICGRTIGLKDADSIRYAAARTLAVGVSGFDDAVTLVDAGIRHLFIHSDTDSQLLDGQGEADRSLAVLQERAAAADGPGGTGITVSVDEEGGRAQRLTDLAGKLPSAREMAATMSPSEVTELFSKHARSLRGLGITMDFAPDIDLDGTNRTDIVRTTERENATGDRVFSADPNVVVNYGRAVIEGLLAGGITPVIKHFPGYGHATGDAHTEAASALPLKDIGPDLQPFVELVQIPGVAVMVGHVNVPDVNAETEAGAVKGADTPASLNPAVYALLREGVDGRPEFVGQVFTDDLTGMQAINDNIDVGEVVIQALEAGADMPLLSSKVEARAVPDILAAMVTAVVDGRLSLQRLAEAGSRNCAASSDA